MLLSQTIYSEPDSGVRRVSGADVARYLNLMGRVGKVNLTAQPESGGARAELEILLLGLVVLKVEAHLDAPGFERLQEIMASASLLEW